MDKKKNNNNDRYELQELFMAKAGKLGWDRCFYGTIKREIDSDDNPVVIGRIKVGDGFVCTQASNQWILGDRLDELVLMKLDIGLHSDAGKTSVIAGNPFHYN